MTKRTNTHTLHATDSAADCVECILTLSQQSTSEGTGRGCHMVTCTQTMSPFKQGQQQYTSIAAITHYDDSIYTTAVVTQHLHHNGNIYEQRRLHSCIVTMI